MRIKCIDLAWFRGAADSVRLEPNCKSIAVYGSNGSGKSCFIDAIEYLMSDGRIEHLRHEYSGRKQEKAIPNTHTPDGQQCRIAVKFADDSEHKVTIAKDGSPNKVPSTTAAVSEWEYRRTVLRQHEVSDFIHATKGEKYSALLPLLGLHPLEVAAENVRQLPATIEQVASLAAKRAKLQQVSATRTEVFADATDDEIIEQIERLHKKYCPDKPETTDPLARCKELKPAIDSLIAAHDAEVRRYVALSEIASVDLKAQISAVRSTQSAFAGVAESLITEKLRVLESAGEFADKITEGGTVDCPACGREIAATEFKAHIEAERLRLAGLIEKFSALKSAVATLCEGVRSLQRGFQKAELKALREELTNGPLAEHLAYLEKINIEQLRSSCGETELSTLEDHVQPLIDAAIEASTSAPPEAQELSKDKKTVEVATEVLEARAIADEIKRAEALITFLKAVEQGIRDEIRQQAGAVVSAITSDVQAMWSILHPGEPIDNIRLYLAPDVEKAIDVALKFHGVEQDSPRLTLSEGHRNSLGLCIFLAMAKRESSSHRPVFLDDVVVSFDREHRGMIADVLAKHFNDRQVIILTHDRDWFTDLRVQLDPKTWHFRILLPYETPELGIRWSHKATTFDDARGLLKSRPDAAGNDARKIMDVELALAAEKLEIRLPYLRGDKNDKRMAHQFLERMIADGKKCLQKKSGADYPVFQEALDAMDCADKLLVSWGNRASHTDDVVRREATKLIDACDKALGSFKCPKCGQFIWIANATSKEWVQCQCGELRWRYG